MKNPNLSIEKELSGSRIILEAFLQEGVKTIFGYPGGAIIPIYDALYDYQEKLKHILVRHEQAAVHAAQGLARVSGEVGVVMATSGPGATNLVTGLADALLDNTPVVCITGQVFDHLLGTDAFQEIDVMNITSPVTKWNYQVTDANELPEVLAKAFYIARSGRPGPVLIDVTKNAQLQHVLYTGYTPCHSLRSYRPDPVPCMDSIEKAAALINTAEKPFIIAGQGILLGKAEKEFLEFAEKSGIPVAWTVLGMSAIPTDHPQAVGMVGMHGNYGPNVLSNQCDVLIAVGMRFDDRVTGRLDQYVKQAKVIHLDIDKAEINKNVIVDVPILGNCKHTLPLLTELIQKRQHPDWHKKFKDCYEIESINLINRELYPEEGEITMGEVIRCLNEMTEGEAVIVTDVGQHQMATCRYSKFNNSRTNITSGGLGTMGFCLPAAMGAAYGDTGRQIIAVMGDGGAQMNIQELGTIMQYRPEIKILILNNSYLGMVRQWQELFHEERYSSVDIKSPDFVQVAKGYDIPGRKVSQRVDLENGLLEMLDHRGTFLLEVMTGKEHNVFPMIPQGKSVSEIVLNNNF
ncbi:acetolactate synthase, large subunit, biosynthetic type [Chryseobacterium lactis]|uniref:Acetolactate synthase n=1 Tax=Chryseobacterium lactis TaxID=1241981 RepID=A0A3G6RNY8_CHRLC|nr:biosynthetic-type acetolactate synthase large subunit [Chryseobacterium lactis]AZA82808.1 biosynthetic-type acetolactate synthase large subunit [Chryseobacterium lactis]AZB03190.1 biosynthetic-type acetolactate synthase large subunit [Chryseobacterium lactis]PNW11259.1 acetolactate synthase, large subunit, biosynthetic type [Chryseobacterium lactis]